MSVLFETPRRRARKISMIPMINVIFMLVFFFLVGGQLQKVTIVEVDLPKAATGKILDEGPVEMILGKYDEIIINDVMFTDASARAELKHQIAMNPERIVTIKADANAQANRLVAFMEMIRAVGGKNLSLITEKEGSGGA